MEDHIRNRQRRLRLSASEAQEHHAETPWDGYIDVDAVRENFEAFCRQPPNYYNLTRSVDEGRTYWALSTERAFAIYLQGVRDTMKGM